MKRRDVLGEWSGRTWLKHLGITAVILGLGTLYIVFLLPMPQ